MEIVANTYGFEKTYIEILKLASLIMFVNKVKHEN